MTLSTYISKRQYRPDIDGLRGVAVMLVVAFHAFPGRIPGGLSAWIYSLLFLAF